MTRTCQAIGTETNPYWIARKIYRWAEIYLPGYGWIPVDPDRGDEKTPRAQALGFGNLDNTLLVTTTGPSSPEVPALKKEKKGQEKQP
jgi:transglutaminase-like putative cysteine protease